MQNRSSINNIELILKDNKDAKSNIENNEKDL